METFSDRLRRASTDLALASLAEIIETEALQPIGEIVNLATSLPEEMADKSRAILERLEMLTILSLFRVVPGVPTHTVRVHQLLAATDGNLLQKSIAATSKMLDDQRPVPLPPDYGLKEETSPPPRRLCDEAYLVLRRLMHVAETEDEYWLNAEAFLNVPMAERDAEIARIQSGGQWRDYLQAEEGTEDA